VPKKAELQRQRRRNYTSGIGSVAFNEFKAIELEEDVIYFRYNSDGEAQKAAYEEK
jgi:hypothetical protein